MDLASIFLDSGHGEAQLLVPMGHSRNRLSRLVVAVWPRTGSNWERVPPRVHTPVQGSWSLWL